MSNLTIREQLEKLVPDIKELSSLVDTKASAGSDCTDEIANLETQLTEYDNLTKAFTAIAKANGSMDVAKAFLVDLATGAGISTEDVSKSTGIVNPNGMTLGEAFSKSPAYQDFLGQFKGNDGTIRNVPISKAADYEFGAQTKTPIFGLSDTSAGAFITTQRLGVISDLIGQRRLTVADLCTHINITGDTFDYVTVTTKTNNAATVLEATTSATPGLNNVAVGAYTAAHGLKPESALAFAVVSSIVETIAHLIPISRRAAADAPQVRAMIDEFLLYGIQEELEDQILNGDGTTPNLRGILVAGSGINTVGSAGTDLDAIVAGIAAVRADNREPTAMVVNPLDWYTTGFLLAKDTAGNYLVAQPSASIDQLSSLWGLRVVVTPAMTENTVLIGDFRQAVVADRQQGTIYVTDSHNDWFARNLLAILGEARYGFGVLDIESFCTVTAV